MQKRISDTLRILGRIGSVGAEIEGDPGTFEQSITQWKSEEKNPHWNLEINIYGPLELKKKVGDELSAKKVYLQQPRFVHQNLSVQNPHFITFPNIIIEPKELTESGSALPSFDAHQISNTDFCEILGRLDHSEELTPAPVNFRHTTPLLE